ncbi:MULTISPECIES: cupin domain-containing protein [unclassified Methylophaga]|jgi:ethanolamine utilization protein EutQ (cupin superfamily)|uniref:cupin domain-containing protein n=1 Tax=unclassified Methylophaga TaxID=2629249 RepID=UPI00259CB6EF|nr:MULTISPECIES: cupin domain-containing protein [unclassified Methylophaga]|tara:strand:- start:3926 stop:4267 length:342 start_codon:yes stop_codon:yes gene_type:complete
MKYIQQAVKDAQPSMGVDGVNATLGDTVISGDKDKTICAGFFHLNKSDEPLVYTYDYEEMKYIAEGEFIISDESGKQVHAKVGDVLYFANGETITFTTPSRGVGFFVGQRNPI